ncbi:MAG: alkaline phosphatase PhoX [Myxococcota bacterium]
MAKVVTHKGLLLPRRQVLRRGLAGLASALVGPRLFGCGDDGSTAPDASPATDANADATLDASGMDADAAAALTELPERTVPARPALRSLIAEMGPLTPPDPNGVRLATGFTSRVLATSQQRVPGTMHEWHLAPDGGATFATEDDGWIYVSNSEVPFIGGVGALRFDSAGTLTSAYSMLRDTQVNCAGGPTPWHSWLSCEEIEGGRVFECDPWGEHEAILRPALGFFKHEAAAVDPDQGVVYLTEDERRGGFYRFIPNGRTPLGRPNLSEGTLEIASVDMMGAVTWFEVPDPNLAGPVPTRQQVPESTEFNGGEGIWYHDGMVYFTTKGDTRVWAYEVATSQIAVLYDGEAIANPPLTGVDNVTVSCCGDVLVAEDGGSMQIVAILPSGELKPLMQIVGQDRSEITGPAFDPSGTRLYFSSQRGIDGNGITYEIEGPFHEPA